jgi:hypothetical protein
MSVLSNYAGLIETFLAFGGVSLFVWWQMRVLNRDVKAREMREREAADLANRGFKKND